jgi:hypothetical protein
MAYIRRKPLDCILILGFSLAIIKLFTMYSYTEDNVNWEKFKAEKNCTLLNTKIGEQQTSWECADGKTHYRWRQQR